MILALLAFASLITSLDYNIVYVALPSIGTSLGFSSQTLQWVVSGYAVAFGAMLLAGGRASDLLGRRRMFVSGLTIYAVSSLAGGLAASPGLLITGRLLQGLGGALLFPATLSLVSTSFAEGAARNRAFSIWAAAGSSGLILGSLLGGLLTQAFGWRAVFFVNVPLALSAVMIALKVLPADPPRGRGRTFDLPGAAAATAAALLLVFTLVQGPVAGWGSPLILGTGAAGAGLAAVFMAIEARTEDPLMPLRLFTNPSLKAGLGVNLMFMATFGTTLYFLTNFLQNVHGYSPLRMGIAYLVPLAAGTAGTLVGGQAATRFGVRATLAWSLAVGAIGTLLLGLAMIPSSGYVLMVPGLVIGGLGQGATYPAMFAAASAGAAPAEQGVVSGIISTGQQIGGALGLAVLVAIANGRTGSSNSPDAVTAGLRLAVLVTAAAIAATVLVARMLRRPEQAANQNFDKFSIDVVGA